MILLRDCHFYFVSESLSQPVPLSKSFRSTFLRWYLRQNRRRCSPKKLNIVLLELAKILQEPHSTPVTFLHPTEILNKTKSSLVNEDPDNFRPPTPRAKGDPTERLHSNSQSSNSLETGSFECLETAIREASNPAPRSRHRRKQTDWIQSCLEHQSIQEVSHDQHDPIWECFRESVEGAGMDPTETSNSVEGVVRHQDLSILKYERTWDRLLHPPSIPPEPSPSLLIEPVQEQEMEREGQERKEAELRTPERKKPRTFCSCRWGRRFRVCWETYLFRKTQTQTST